MPQPFFIIITIGLGVFFSRGETCQVYTLDTAASDGQDTCSATSPGLVPGCGAQQKGPQPGKVQSHSSSPVHFLFYCLYSYFLELFVKIIHLVHSPYAKVGAGNIIPGSPLWVTGTPLWETFVLPTGSASAGNWSEELELGFKQVQAVGCGAGLCH